MNIKPKVSILCITYNHVDFISKAIEGFLMQKTNFTYEIIINDDASTDGTSEIVKKYERENPNVIKSICQLQNQYSKGVNIMADILLPKSKGDYIAICEGDDYWTDANKLQIQVDYMEKHKNCSICFHLADEISLLDNTVRKGAPFLWTRKISLNLFNRRRTIIETCSFLCRKQAMLPLPKYYYDSSVGDLPLVLHLLTKGYGYYINRNMATHLYMVPGSWSERHSNLNLNSYILEAKSRISMFQDFDEQTGYKYHKVAQAEINLRLFNIELEKGNIEAAKNIIPYCRTSVKASILNRIKLMNPGLYNNLIAFRKWMRIQK